MVQKCQFESVSVIYIFVFSCSICNDQGSGKIFSWGSNSDGQLGVGDTADRLAPTRVMGIQGGVVQFSAGCVSSAALTGKVLLHTSTQCAELVFHKFLVTNMNEIHANNFYLSVIFHTF
jgi:hypothetical protein